MSGEITSFERLEMQRETLRKRGICVIIPTYNNRGTITDVVSRSLVQCDDVIVVCDGCTDDTLDLLNKMERRPTILDLKRNRGKGGALKEGFKYARGAGFAYAITLDGDGQHFPEDIPLMLEANIKHPGALIVGERQFEKNAERSAGSKFANSFSNFWFGIQTGHFLKDTQTGYRLYPLKKLYGLPLLTSRYEAELELIVFASWHGVRLVSNPVNVYYPPKEERVSHFRPGKDFARITVLNSILCLLALVYALPLAILRWSWIIFKTVYSLLFFIITSMFVATPLASLYMSIGEVTEKKKYNLHRIINFMGRFVLFYHRIPGIRYSQTNRFNEDFSKPSVIICNHQSHLDIVPLIALHPKIIILTANWVWNNPIYKHLIRHAEFLPASAGVDAIMPHLKSLVERGYSIAIYPEGTRSEDCSIGRFHQGAFHIAQTLDTDILPIILYGTGKALPKRGRTLRKWPVHLDIDKRISPEELRKLGESTRIQASQMRRYYINRYKEISDKVEQNV